MNDLGVCYAGYWAANSGMGEAARNIIGALNEVNVNLTTELIPNIKAIHNLGFPFEIAKSLHAKDVDYQIKIIHITPDLVTKHLEPTKYHIFHLFWETDRLPKWWVWSLNLCDEIWTGDEYHKKAFIDSGVKRPIYVFPQPIDINIRKEKPFRFINKIPKEEKFWFYSIFQWIERKDPKSLIQAYWREFQDEDRVGLILKVFKERFTSQETDQILQDIIQWKKELNLSHYPTLYIFPGSLDSRSLFRIHETGDCFVLPHRGEGWGRPVQEALFLEKPVISTNLGGIHEYILRDCAYLLNYDEVPVFNMEFSPWYDSKTQKWGQVDMVDLRAKMRYVFNNQEKAKEVGKRASNFVKREFSYEKVGNLMKQRLLDIRKTL